ncbi:hypothetical protein BESB_008250 [Besnoitia besnoiti]|uniref:Uncharacterized protein n=1 Tax=Besnoitia besnoiti TaxID=94643 RepID=A0A2A9MQF9_BESBE|nr:hypothetical protein BESB_008250 [Besnoitia besnoiti]PFH38483.1 hypothetical protein BESB_008250 [Besnoitia besnoiti]
MAAPSSSPALSAALSQVGRDLQKAISKATSTLASASGERGGTLATAGPNTAALLSPLFGVPLNGSLPPSGGNLSSAKGETPYASASSAQQHFASSEIDTQAISPTLVAGDESCVQGETARLAEDHEGEPGQPREPLVSLRAVNPPPHRISSPGQRDVLGTNDASNDVSVPSPVERNSFFTTSGISSNSGGNHGGGGKETGRRWNPYAAAYYTKGSGAAFRHRMGTSTGCCSLLSSPCAPPLCSSSYMQPATKRRAELLPFSTMGLAGGGSRLDETENSWFFVDLFSAEGSVSNRTFQDSRGSLSPCAGQKAQSNYSSRASPPFVCSLPYKREDGLAQILDEDAVEFASWSRQRAEVAKAVGVTPGLYARTPNEGDRSLSIEDRTGKINHSHPMGEASLGGIESRSLDLVRISDPSVLGGDASLLASTLSSELIEESQAASLTDGEERCDSATRGISAEKEEGHEQLACERVESHTGTATMQRTQRESRKGSATGGQRCKLSAISGTDSLRKNRSEMLQAMPHSSVLSEPIHSTSGQEEPAMVAFLRNSIDLYGHTALEGVTFHVPVEDAEDLVVALEEVLPYSWHDFESAAVEALKPLTALVIGRLVFVQLPSFLFEFLATTEGAAAAAAGTAEAAGASAAGVVTSVCSFASWLVVFGGCVYALVRGAQALQQSRRAQLLMSVEAVDATGGASGAAANKNDGQTKRGETAEEKSVLGDAIDVIIDVPDACETDSQNDAPAGRASLGFAADRSTAKADEGTAERRAMHRADVEGGKPREMENSTEDNRGEAKSVVVIRRDPTRKWKEEAVCEGMCSIEWCGGFPLGI